MLIAEPRALEKFKKSGTCVMFIYKTMSYDKLKRRAK